MYKKILASALAALMLCACGVSGFAAETVVAPGPVQPDYVDTVGQQATVLAMQAKSGAYASMTVKTDSYEQLVLHFSKDTVLMDTQTGAAAAEADIKAGDTVYVYYDDMVMETYPPQTYAQAVLVHLDENHAPAHLLTVEAIDTRTNAGVTVEAENGGLLLTVPAATPIEPLQAQNSAKLRELRVGMRFFAWYDAVDTSMPAQAAATKIVVPQQADRALFLVIEGDMVIADGARMEGGVAMVPLRAAAEALGYTVTWEGATRSVLLSNGAIESPIRIGQDSYYYRSVQAIGMTQPLPLGAAAYLENSRTYVPASLFALLGEPLSLRGDTLHIGVVESNSTELPNPIAVVDSAAAFVPLGLPIDAPEGATKAEYAVIGGYLAQVQFSLDGAQYTYRAAKTTDDISGVYKTFEDTAMGINTDYENGSTLVTVRKTVDGDLLAHWQNGAIRGSLYAADNANESAFSNLAVQLARQTMVTA